MNNINKVYKITYRNMFTNKNTIEDNEEVYTYNQINAFIERVKYLNEQCNIEELKVYSGELNEIDLKTVLNPF